MARRKQEQRRNQSLYKQSSASYTDPKFLRSTILILEKSTSELKELGLKEIKLDEGLTSKLDTSRGS